MSLRPPGDPSALASVPAAPREASPGSRPQRLDWQRAIAGFALAAALIGVAIASYLAVENLQGKTGVCTVVHGCQTVQQSRYGKVFGIPVSVPGLAGYVSLAVLALVVLTGFRGLRPLAAAAGFYLALFGFLVSCYLTYIEGWVLHAWCIYCIASASLMTLLLLLWTIMLAIEVHRRSDTGPPIRGD